MSEQKETTNPDLENEETQNENPSSIDFVEEQSAHSEVVELSWEEVEETLQLRQLYKETENAFSRFLVDQEETATDPV